MADPHTASAALLNEESYAGVKKRLRAKYVLYQSHPFVVVPREPVAQPAAPTSSESFVPEQQSFLKKMKIAGQRLNNIGMGKVRIELIQSLAMMLNAGVLVSDALKMYLQEVRSRSVKKVIQGMIDGVESGKPLWKAMEEQHMFSPYQTALVHVGEESGNLARNLVYLAEQEEKDRALRSKVKMAMIYPTIVLVVMVTVMLGIGMFVLPNLVQVLVALNAELPLATRIIIAVTNFLRQYGSTAIPVLIGTFLALVLLGKFTAFRIVTQWLFLHIPGIGRLMKEASIARLGVILGGLLQAGVPLVDSLRSLEHVTTVVVYKNMYRILAERAEVGDSFATCFHGLPHSCTHIPISVQQLIVMGEKSGTLAETLLGIAQIYEKKAEETAQKLPVILEPMLMIIMAGLVGFIAISIIMPIYRAVGSIGNG